MNWGQLLGDIVLTILPHLEAWAIGKQAPEPAATEEPGANAAEAKAREKAALRAKGGVS